jgi:hypothetical protein
LRSRSLSTTGLLHAKVVFKDTEDNLAPLVVLTSRPKKAVVRVQESDEKPRDYSSLNSDELAKIICRPVDRNDEESSLQARNTNKETYKKVVAQNVKNDIQADSGWQEAMKTVTCEKEAADQIFFAAAATESSTCRPVASLLASPSPSVVYNEQHSQIGSFLASPSPDFLGHVDGINSPPQLGESVAPLSREDGSNVGVFAMDHVGIGNDFLNDDNNLMFPLIDGPIMPIFGSGLHFASVSDEEGQRSISIPSRYSESMELVDSPCNLASASIVSDADGYGLEFEEEEEHVQSDDSLTVIKRNDSEAYSQTRRTMKSRVIVGPDASSIFGVDTKSMKQLQLEKLQDKLMAMSIGEIQGKLQRQLMTVSDSVRKATSESQHLSVAVE